ncbi:MAG: TonB family protein [Pseudoxanthomonas sp.]
MIAEFLGTLFETTLATSAAALLVLCLRKPLMAKFGASVAHAAWGLVPVAWLAVLLPAPTAPAARMALLPGLAMRVQEAAPLQPAMQFPWQAWLAGAWLLGVAVAAWLFWMQQRRFQLSLQGCTVRADGLRQARATQGLPAVVGVLRPRIVLPADFDSRYGADERELILCHERIHIRRRDLQANALVVALRALYWFNPLLHYAASRFRRDQELACDERVVARHPQQRRRYADAMLKTQMADSSLPLGCHWQASNPLKERIEMLKQHAPKPLRTFAGVALVALLSVAGGYAAWAAQPPRADAIPVARVDIASKNTHPPIYPADAMKNRVTGKVLVIVDVGADGSVTQAKIEKAEPAGVFDAAVLEAVGKWKFEPAVENGKPVAGRVRVPIDFDMDRPDSEAAG